MNHTHHRLTHPKVKRSYSLSPESVAFLESVRKTKRSASVSAVLEEIIQAARRASARAALDCPVSDYYSSLTQAEMDEETAWGEFVLEEMRKEIA